jgi:hypothetical protein
MPKPGRIMSLRGQFNLIPPTGLEQGVTQIGRETIRCGVKLFRKQHAQNGGLKPATTTQPLEKVGPGFSPDALRLVFMRHRGA